MITPHLPNLLSLGELRELRETLRSSSANGILSYLRAIERKSWWSFVDAALEEFAADPDETVFRHVSGIILGKTNYNERLSDADRDRIAERLKVLAGRDDRRFARIIQLIEFSLRR